MMTTHGAHKHPNPTTQRFIFATGIECSYPTIEWEGKTVRRDQLRECGHYDRWREDLQLTLDVGCRFLRYGVPYYSMHLGPGRYDWSFSDEVLPAMRAMGIVPILDICHFGVPDWLGNFQNPEFATHFADFSRAFAERYPWIRFYTPVNEMYIAAEFSAYYGWWNERLTSHRAFVTALKNMVRANVEAMMQILEVRPDALFIQSESSEYTHGTNPDLADEAEILNERRFLSLDLNYGHPLSATMYRYVLDNGMTQEEYDFFMHQNLREHCVLGNDYYAANEHLLINETTRVYGGDIFGYYLVTKDYYSRYNLPAMCTETNVAGPGAELWLWKTWAHIQRLRAEGVPVCGLTWYSLIDQIDWDTALRELNYRTHAVGLYDLDRKLRPVGKAFKNLISQWDFEPLLPNGPLTLVGDWDVAQEQEKVPPVAQPESKA